MVKIIENIPMRWLKIEHPRDELEKMYEAQKAEGKRGTFMKILESAPKFRTAGEVFELSILIDEDRADAFLEAITNK
jgi:hypothetical protein